VVEVIADVMRWSRALMLEDFRVVDFTEPVPSLSSAPAFLATAGARPRPSCAQARRGPRRVPMLG
jgi:hypothetical protein